MNLHRLRSRTSAFIMTPEYLVTAFHLLPSTMAHLILEKKTKSKGFLEFSPVSVVFDRKTEHVSLWHSKVDARTKQAKQIEKCFEEDHIGACKGRAGDCFTAFLANRDSSAPAPLSLKEICP